MEKINASDNDISVKKRNRCFCQRHKHEMEFFKCLSVARKDEKKDFWCLNAARKGEKENFGVKARRGKAKKRF